MENTKNYIERILYPILEDREQLFINRIYGERAKTIIKCISIVSLYREQSSTLTNEICNKLLDLLEENNNV